jgi:hypothetical protein
VKTLADLIDPEELVQTACPMIMLIERGTLDMKCVEILTTAADLVAGDRNKTHGSKQENFDHTAALWSAYLAPTLKRPLTADEVTMCMVLLKISRTINGTKIDDHYVDMAGYAAISGEVRPKE